MGLWSMAKEQFNGNLLVGTYNAMLDRDCRQRLCRQ